MFLRFEVTANDAGEVPPLIFVPGRPAMT